MHHIPFPKIIVFSLISLFLLYSSLAGQKKAAAEVDVAKCWSYPLGDAGSDKISVSWDKIFVGLEGGRVEAITSLDGTKIWSAEFGGKISSNFLVVENGLFFTTSISSTSTAKTGSKLRSISKDTGITNWTAPLPDAEREFIGRFNGSIVVVSQSGAIVSIDAKTGIVKWTRQIAESFVAEPSFTPTTVIVATAGKQIFGISLSTGEIDSMRKVSFGVTALAQGEDDLIVGDERGNLVYYAVKSSKAKWRFKSGGEVSNIFLIYGDVLAVSQDNFLYFVNGRNGDRAWKRRLAGRVAQIATAPNHYARYAIIQTFGESRVEVIDLQTGKVAGQIMFGEDESLVSQPVVDSNGVVFLLTNDAVYAYSSKYFARK